MAKMSGAAMICWMYVRFDPERDEHVKRVWLDRVAQKMEEDENSFMKPRR